MKGAFWDDKVVWITGASSGIGRSLALALAQCRVSLILSGRDMKRLEDVLKETRSLGSVSVEILPFELADLDAIEQIVDVALSYFGDIDVLINNGGISQRSLAKETAFEVDQQIMDVNYFAPVKLTKTLLDRWSSLEGKQIVVVSSLAAKISLPKRSAYSASKHALHGFFGALRYELSPFGACVILVCPGYVKTDLSWNALTASGDRYKKNDANQKNGMSPDLCATKTLKAIENSKAEVYFGGLKEISALLISRFFPSLFRNLMTVLRINQ